MLCSIIILINLLHYSFYDAILNMFFIIVFWNSWYLYYLTVNTITTPVGQSTDVKKPKKIEIGRSMRLTIIGALLLCFVLINIIFIFNINTSIILFDTVYLSHNLLNYLSLSLLVLLIILLSGFGLFNQNISFSCEYIIFVFLLVITSYMLLSSTNLFITTFLLELIALLIFGKMAVSRITIKKSLIDSSNSFSKTQYSYGLFHSLFFQFWANFVSSICLFFSLINIHYIFGTSNFFVINFLLNIISNTWYITNTYLIITLVIITTGLFIKLGLSPYQFFKIEVYKGIPLYILIIYTTVYFLVYIYFFLFLFIYQIPSLRYFTGFYLWFIIFISLIYLVSLLFDTKNFKAFLSYSTLITISNILIIILNM